MLWPTCADQRTILFPSCGVQRSKLKLSGLLVVALTDRAITLALASIQSLCILNLEEIGPFLTKRSSGWLEEMGWTTGSHC